MEEICFTKMRNWLLFYTNCTILHWLNLGGRGGNLIFSNKVLLSCLLARLSLHNVALVSLVFPTLAVPAAAFLPCRLASTRLSCGVVWLIGCPVCPASHPVMAGIMLHSRYRSGKLANGGKTGFIFASYQDRNTRVSQCFTCFCA